MAWIISGYVSKKAEETTEWDHVVRSATRIGASVAWVGGGDAQLQRANYVPVGVSPESPAP